MGNRILPLETNTTYHIYNRGFNKQTLFYDAQDYHYFLQGITRYKKRFKGIKISAYCLLPNHFHFLLIDERMASSNSTDERKVRVRTVSAPPEACEISAFMQKLQQSYALYFNNRHGETVKPGLKMPVFEGRFKAKEVLDEAYLSQLVTYVEQNAVKHDLVDDIKDWPYSSWEPGRDFALNQDFFSDFD